MDTAEAGIEMLVTRFEAMRLIIATQGQMLNEARALLQQYGAFIAQFDPVWEVALRGSGTGCGPAHLDSSEHEGSGHLWRSLAKRA